MVPKSRSKTGLKNDRFLVDFGVPFGVQNGAKNGLKTDLGSSRGLRGSQGSILEGFGTILGAILGGFSEGFWTQSRVESLRSRV